MEPLICPQCGGKITNYIPGKASTTCDYCATTFLIDDARFKSRENSSRAEFADSGTDSQTQLFKILGLVLVLFVGGILAIGALIQLNKPKPFSPTNPPPYRTATPTPKPSVTATPKQNLLEFGGTGTGNGLFQDADSIAVDNQGRIYVGDDSLRVQQFSPEGEYLKTIIVPSKTSYYTRARQINKIAVSKDGLLYVAAGGVILVYDDKSDTPIRTIHNAPDYVQDFSVRSDGGILMVSNNEKIETLLYANKSGQITRRIRGFLTDAAEAAVSPPETAMVSIRIAVDAAGNIFGIYGLGDIGSYQLSYNDNELLIFRFNADGKYINKFVESMDSCGIEVDNRGRVYISRKDSIEIYSNNGEPQGGFSSVGQPTAFALDKDNNLYVLAGDKVIKRQAAE